jgi:hypothetical protein
VRRAHLAPLRAEGTIDAEHSRGAFVRAIIRLMQFPPLDHANRYGWR